MSASSLERRLRVLRAIAALAGVLLFAIGVRFLVVPDEAAHTFGLDREIAGFELHLVIGLRDLWLGALAILFAAFTEWRALAVWFGLGTLVCFSDAAIAASSSGRTGPIVFHVVCGFACAFLAGIFSQLGGARPDP